MTLPPKMVEQAARAWAEKYFGQDYDQLGEHSKEVAHNNVTIILLAAGVQEMVEGQRLLKLSETFRNDANKECAELLKLLGDAHEYVCSMACRSHFPAGHVKSDADHIVLCLAIRNATVAPVEGLNDE